MLLKKIPTYIQLISLIMFFLLNPIKRKRKQPRLQRFQLLIFGILLNINLRLILRHPHLRQFFIIPRHIRIPSIIINHGYFFQNPQLQLLPFLNNTKLQCSFKYINCRIILIKRLFNLRLYYQTWYNIILKINFPCIILTKI